MTETADDDAPHVERHITIADVLCVGGIVAAVARFWITFALVPSLLGTHPVLLELLRGSGSSMVTAGAFARDGDANLVAAIFAGIIGLGFFNVFYWWGGRRYGNQLIAFYVKNNPRYQKWVDRSEKFLARWGGLTLIVQYYQPIPNVLLYIGTGASGVSLWMFMLCNFIGCALWVGLMVGLGYAIGHPAVSVAKTISHDAFLATIALILLVFVFAAVRGVRAQRAAERQRDIEESTEAG